MWTLVSAKLKKTGKLAVHLNCIDGNYSSTLLLHTHILYTFWVIVLARSTVGSLDPAILLHVATQLMGSEVAIQ